LTLSVPVNLSSTSGAVVNLSKSSQQSSKMTTTIQDSAVKSHNVVPSDNSHVPILQSKANQWSGGSAVIQNPARGTKSSAENQVSALSQHSGSQSSVKKVAISSQLYPVGKAFPIAVSEPVKTQSLVRPASVTVQPKQAAAELVYAIKTNTSTLSTQRQVLTVVSCAPNSALKSDIPSVQKSDTGANSSSIIENVKQEIVTQPSSGFSVKDSSKIDVRTETTANILPRNTLKVT
jgi:hypothetical protein